MKIRAAFAVLSFLALAAVRAEDMPANQQAETFTTRLNHNVELRYLLFLPEGYKNEGETQKRWPLMLFLHGAGERGTNLARVAVHGPPKIVKTNRDFPFILVSPQCPSGETWSEEALLALLDDIQARYRVDENRVYLTGLSMGGFGTWHLGLNNPGRFAAIVPICGGGDILDVLLAPPGKAASLKRLPIWAFHGAKDPIVPLHESERMVDLLKRNGNPNVKLTVYPEAGHDSWTETYNNPDLYEWLLQQSRQKKTARNRVRAISKQG